MKYSENLYIYPWENPMENNCNSYIIDGKVKTLIDPGHHHLFPQLNSEMKKDGFLPGDIDLVLITHPHPDHCEAAQDFFGYNTKIAIHKEADAFLRQYGEQFYQMMGLTMPPWKVDILLDEGELLVGDQSFDILYTPGHAPGSICIYWREEKALFTGDVVFYQSVGRVDLPGGNGLQLKESIEKIARLDVELLLPGHGPIIKGKGSVKENFYTIVSTVFSML